jgi:hypothetical protein
MFSTPKSKDVNVLPSVSNPASETSPLFPHKNDLPPVPPMKLHTPSSCVKPMNPTEFSCDLYFTLAPNQFADDQAKIMWAFSFMKSEQALCFVDRKMRMYDVVGSCKGNLMINTRQCDTCKGNPKLIEGTLDNTILPTL